MKLFEPYKIGKMELRNRLVMAPMSNNMAENGFVTDKMIKFYEARAKGGVGLITVEDGIVDAPIGHNVQNPIVIDDDKYIPVLKKLNETVKAHGVRTVMQLSHGGRRAGRVAKSGFLEVTRGLIPVGPSSIAHPSPGYVVPRELTIEEIQEVIKKFGQAARRAMEAGFDALGLHCAHMYLCGEFLSPWANKRSDEYGGDFERRMRFPLEVIKRIKKEVGIDYPIIIRMNGQEPEGGNNPEQIRKIAQRFEQAGVDAIHVSAGFAAVIKERDIRPSVPSMYLPDGCNVDLAENVKKGVPIPVIAVGKIRDVQHAEKILQEGKADLIAMGRTLIAEPDFANKAIEGKFDDIRPCISCCQGCIQNVLEKNVAMSCSVNAIVGREGEISLSPAQIRKKVFIVGGGPAGLETARVAAIRGHEVSIYEKQGQLGGNLILAAKPPGKSDIEKLIDYLKNQVSKLGVKVNLGIEATSEVIEKEKPDVVVVATGGEPIIPSIPGAKRENVVTAAGILQGEVNAGQNIVVIGGGLLGVEVADFLATNGKTVTVVEMLNDVAAELPNARRIPLMFRLKDYDVRILTRAKVEEITERGVSISRNAEKKFLEADTVVLAVGFKSRQELIDKLKGKVSEIYAGGDCVEPRYILDAIHEGFDLAIRL